MTRKYLDPHLYCATEDQWREGAYRPQLESVLDLLTAIKSAESAYKMNGLFKFKFSRRQVGAIYNCNPYKNIPPVNQFYHSRFISGVLPEIMRRAHYCPADGCDEIRDVPFALPPVCGAPEVVNLFSAQISDCALCGNNKHAVLFSSPNAPAVQEDSEFFSCRITIGVDDIRKSIDELDLFPNIDDSDKSSALITAARLLIDKLAHDDPSWRIERYSDLRIDDNFWREFERSDFRDLADVYKRRIIYVAAQMIANRAVTTNEHRMIGEELTVEGRNYPKWNAYVFQMGASDQDDRCSRIYFCRLPTHVHWVRYEPSAHG